MAVVSDKETQWLTASEQAVWRAYLDVTRMVNERLNRQLADDADLSLAEYEILVQLSEHPDRAMRMSELAERVVNSRSRLTHTVARLQDRGLVTRQPCPNDGRGVMCTLTPEGMQEIVDAAPGHVAAVRAAIFDCLSERDLADFGRVLDRINDNIRSS